MATNNHNPYEKPLHLIYNERICLSPMPSLSLHLANLNTVYGLFLMNFRQQKIKCQSRILQVLRQTSDRLLLLLQRQEAIKMTKPLQPTGDLLFVSLVFEVRRPPTHRYLALKVIW